MTTKEEGKSTNYDLILLNAHLSMFEDISGWDEEEEVDLKDDDISRVLGIGKKGGSSYHYVTFNDVPPAGTQLNTTYSGCGNGVCYSGQESRRAKSSRARSSKPKASTLDVDRSNFAMEKQLQMQLQSMTKCLKSNVLDLCSASFSHEPARKIGVLQKRPSSVNISSLRSNRMLLADDAASLEVTGLKGLDKPLHRLYSSNGMRVKSATPRFGDYSAERSTAQVPTPPETARIRQGASTSSARLVSALSKLDLKSSNGSSAMITSTILTGRRYRTDDIKHKQMERWRSVNEAEVESVRLFRVNEKMLQVDDSVLALPIISKSVILSSNSAQASRVDQNFRVPGSIQLSAQTCV
ncbi:hypothetical protein HDU97_000461 [Phlyctochytrium planicorne]|nr:hypothetical protein HDU97_000461 [Phlyctochytrium planicorne]